MQRRDALKLFGAGLGLVGGAKALDNVVLGYGTNLTTQDLDALARERFGPRSSFAVPAGDVRVRRSVDALFLLDGEDVLATLDLDAATPADARALDDEYDLPGRPFEQLVSDLTALDAGDYRFVPVRVDPFFERVAAADARAYTVAAVRSGWRVAPDTVRAFADADPADPRATLDGLTEAFREGTNYDVPRYLAGSITDNVLFRLVRLRKYFREDVTYEGLLDADREGMFCYEYAYRAMEALHAAPASAQDPPVVAGRVMDSRHKHVYTAVASVVREGGDLVVPVTFVDYTHSTLYDDFRLTGVMGEGFEAYDDRHRATDIYWD